MNEDEIFLQYVYAYIKERPSIAPRVTDCMVAAIQAALHSAAERAADMETALMASVCGQKKFGDKTSQEFVLAFLKKWQNKTCYRWDSEIEKLEQLCKTQKGK